MLLFPLKLSCMKFLETVFELVWINGMLYVLSFKSTSSELGMGEKGLGHGEGVKSTLFVVRCILSSSKYLLLRIDFPFSDYLYLIQSYCMHCTH